MFHRKLSSLVAVLALAVGTSVVAWADAKDDLAGAIKKVADAPNYTWSSTSENAGGGGFGNGTTTGQYEKGGYIHITMPFGQDNTLEAFIKGNKSIMKGQDGWQTAEEMAAAMGGGGGGRGGFGTMFQNYQTPAQQWVDTAGKLTNVKSSADGFTADMTEDGAKTFMAFRRGGRGGAAAGGAAAGGPEYKNAKGTVKATVKDGSITKLVYHVTGTVSFNGNDRDVDRTTTVDFKDVGSTKITVPDDAKKKLEG